MVEHKIIKSKKWEDYYPTSKLPSSICKLHSFDKNPYIEHQDVSGTSKTVSRRENRVTVISNLVFYLLRIMALSTPTMCYLQSGCK